ncbi:Phosphatidylethanolamine N-methyltransferase [Chlamydiales bacterium SCGC AB-751-O23]|jgi:phosphatidylethanolamine/phosphatidyl-N-methylethanolamine N-methyltransferase|nr:Phosphatidylethanolamine N-methyltransferase [Chlamydiales bacterium SCGC AB-751-O23]
MMKKYLKSVYFLWAKIYDTIIDPMFSFDREKMVDYLKIKDKDKVLEIGVGTGLNLPFYPEGCCVYGTDISEAMLKEAKEKISSSFVELHLLDTDQLSFEDNYFDSSLATFVLRVAPDPKSILRETSRVVKKDGLLVVLDEFSGKHHFLSKCIEPFKVLLGWGKNYSIDALVDSTNWEIQSSESIGSCLNVRVVVLVNMK